MPTTYTAAVWERPNVFTEPQTGEFHDAGGQVWDLRHERFAGGIPMDGTSDCYAAVAAALAAPDVTSAFFPAGFFVYSGPDYLEVTAEKVGMHFRGAGDNLTTLKYLPSVPADYLDYPRHGVITFNGAQFGSVTGMTLIHGGSRSELDEDGVRQRVAGDGYALPVHGYGVKIVDSNNISVDGNRFPGGLHGVYVHSDVDELHSYEWTANRNIRITRNYCYELYNAGIYIEHAFAPLVHWNWCENCGYDGIKAAGFSFMPDVCFNSCTGNGRDGIDTHPAGRGGRVSFNRCWNNSEFGIECKGLLLEDFPDYGVRDFSFNGNICWDNGVGGSWSNPGSDPAPNFALTELRAVDARGNVSIGGSGEGLMATNCQGVDFGFKIVRPSFQGASFSGCSRNRIDVEALDAGYEEGEEPGAGAGTYDGLTFANGSSLNTVIAPSGNNSTAKPGATRYFATFDASSTGNTIIAGRATNTLNGVIAQAVSSVDGVGRVTMSAPFDVAAAFAAQAVSGYYDSQYRGVRMLALGRPGVGSANANAEFGIERKDAGVVTSDLLLQVQAALVRIYTLADVPLQWGTSGMGWIELNHNGSLAPLTLTQRHGSLDFPWLESHAVKHFSGAANWKAITGSPEGVETAPVGSVRTRLDGGAGTTLYVKESGSGNTGWVAK